MADLWKPRFTTRKVESKANATYQVLGTPFIFQRWSESIFACNILSESLTLRLEGKGDQRWDFIIPIFRVTHMLFNLSCRTFIEGEIPIVMLIPQRRLKNPFINKLWVFIFEEVRLKSVNAHNLIETRKIFEARGNLFLQGRPGAVDLLEFVTKPTYDVSVILWHIATEICYRQENLTKRNDEREFSKILSDYMFYLLRHQSNLMSTVAGFAKFNINSAVDCLGAIIIEKNLQDVKELCEAIYKDVNVEVLDWTNPFDLGIALAHKMESFGERKWKVMSGVWVEMLSYAAGHVKEEAHLQVLSKGGELLTFVWLLVAHFGCVYKPEWGYLMNYLFDEETEAELKDENGNQEEDVSTVEAELV